MWGTHLFCTNTLKLDHIENTKAYNYYILNDCLNPKKKILGSYPVWQVAYFWSHLLIFNVMVFFKLSYSVLKGNRVM